MSKYIIKEIEYYSNLKKKMDSVHKHVWGKHIDESEWGLSHSWFIGSDVSLCKRINPKNYQEFYDKYVDEYSIELPLLPEPNEKDKKDKEERYNNGRTEDYLLQLARKFKELYELIDDKIFTLTEYYDLIICHVIIETFNGYKNELNAQNIILTQNPNYKIIPIDSSYLDNSCGIDFFIKSDSDLLYMIQVKPKSFFVATRTDVVKDKQNHMIGGVKYNNLKKWVDNNRNKYKFGNENLLFMVYDSRNNNDFIKINNKYTNTINNWNNYFNEKMKYE